MDDKNKTYNFKLGEVLLVHKPLQWTSFDVVKKLRYHIKKRLDVKKIKVGHAGTLDPLADGLLILCTGKKTKTIESLMGLRKEYTGTIRLGATTPSYDLETEIDQEFSTDHIDENAIIEMAKQMEGMQEQYPPVFSAKKVKGKKAYDMARKGEEVKLKSKKIEINKFDIQDINENDISFLIQCSKGTYIRSIAHDFGQNLNSGGHLTALRREKIGDYSLKDAKNVDQWIKIIENSPISTDY